MADRFYNATPTARALALSGAPLASFRRRAFAFALDLGLLLLVAGVVTFIFEIYGQKSNHVPPDPNVTIEISLRGLYGIASVVAYFGLFTYLGRGQTPGKRIAKVRVVSTLGEELKLWQSLSRALGYATSAVELGLGFLKYYATVNRQTTHDQIASTIVVKSHSATRRGA
jgi:uncharacterized RDD family membrane protein YckC